MTKNEKLQELANYIYGWCAEFGSIQKITISADVNNGQVLTYEIAGVIIPDEPNVYSTVCVNDHVEHLL